MPRRDQLTYDVEQPRRRVPVAPLLLLGLVVLVTALLVTWVVRSTSGPGTATSPAASTAPVAASPTPAATPTTPTASPSASGSDAHEDLAVPEGSQAAASRFVSAWLDRNPKTRKPALQQVSAPALAEELALTDPANIPKARPKGAPVLEDASTFSAQFTQALSTGARIRVYLVADPDARYQWLATSVEQA